MPVTDIVKTGDKALVPQEGLRKATGGKVSIHSLCLNTYAATICPKINAIGPGDCA